MPRRSENTNKKTFGFRSSQPPNGNTKLFRSYKARKHCEAESAANLHVSAIVRPFFNLVTAYRMITGLSRSRFRDDTHRSSVLSALSKINPLQIHAHVF